MLVLPEKMVSASLGGVLFPPTIHHVETGIAWIAIIFVVNSITTVRDVYRPLAVIGVPGMPFAIIRHFTFPSRAIRPVSQNRIT